MIVNDAHCHFFSTTFFATLGRGMPGVGRDKAAEAALATLGWDAPGAPVELADRWAAELDRHGVSRAALIASVPGDADSVAAALARHPGRFVGYFMVDPTQPDAVAHAANAIDQGRLRVISLFPAMHRYSLHDDSVRRLFDVAAARPGAAVFVHCGVLTIGVRAKLGLPSRFDLRCGNPLDIHTIALAYPTVPIIVPHFGAGFLREALMLADLCPNVLLDTSSSNAWIKYHPRLSLADVFAQALAVVGPERLLFGTDSSFFPRGWVRDVFERQRLIVQQTDVDDAHAVDKIFSGNFDRLFPR